MTMKSDSMHATNGTYNDLIFERRKENHCML